MASCAPGTLRPPSPYGSQSAGSLQQKWLFSRRSAGVTLLLQVSPSPAAESPKRDSPSLSPPSLGHPPSPVIDEGMEPRAMDRPQAPSMPSRVPFTTKSLHCPPLPSPRRPPRSRGVTLALGLRSARRPLSAAALSPQPPLTAGPDLLPGRTPGFARHPVQPISARHAGGRAGSHQPESGFLRRPRSAPAGPRRRGVPPASDRDGGPGPGGAAGERPRRQRPARRVSTGRAAGQGRAVVLWGARPAVPSSAGGCPPRGGRPEAEPAVVPQPCGPTARSSSERYPAA